MMRIGLFIVCMLLTLLAGCRSNDAAPNQAPVARAGDNQTVMVGDVISLDGSASSDPDDDALSFSWQFLGKPAGSASSLENVDTAEANFSADVVGDYVLELSVSDGELEASDTLTVSAQANDGNQAPVAQAGADQTVSVGALVSLDGSSSSDPDGDSLNYSWSFTSIPQGSTADLNGADTSSPNFTADLEGSYELTLSVSDGELQASDSVTITATAEPLPNRAPTADAGDDQTVEVGDLVRLDGSGSSDPDSDTLSYSWRFVTRASGSAASLSGDATPVPDFTADEAGDYTLELTVSDGELTASDRVTVTAAPGSTEPGSILYVSPDGDDGNSGTEAQPFKTLKKALEVAHDQAIVQRVELADGSYTRSADEPFDYTITKDLSIVGESQAGVVLDTQGQAAFELDNDAFLTLLRLSIKNADPAAQVRRGNSLDMVEVTCTGANTCVQAGVFLASSGGNVSVRNSTFEGEGEAGAITAVTAEAIEVRSSSLDNFDIGISILGSPLRVENSSFSGHRRAISILGEDEEQLLIRGGSMTNNDYGVYALGASNLKLESVEIQNSGLNGLYLEASGGVILEDVTVKNSSNSGVLARKDTVLTLLGGRYTGNDTGVFVTESASISADSVGAEIDHSRDDNLVFLTDATGSLTDFYIHDGGGAGVFIAEDSQVVIQDGRFEANGEDGLRAVGAASLSATGISSKDNTGNGIDFNSSGEFSLKESLLEHNKVNIRIRGAPGRVDLGTQAQPSTVTLCAGDATEWNLSDERPDLGSPDASLAVQAVGLRFCRPGGVALYPNGLYTGPDDRSNDWRITGANQQIRF